MQRSPLDRLMGRWTLDTSPTYVAMDLMSRLLSPYDLNPTGFNPLRSILEESIDFERLSGSPIKLFVTATNVRTGRGRIFRNQEITADVLLASACLPTVFRAVEIDGEAYWDGGRWFGLRPGPNDAQPRMRSAYVVHHLADHGELPRSGLDHRAAMDPVLGQWTAGHALPP